MHQLIKRIENGGLDEALMKIYGKEESVISWQKCRYMKAVEMFEKTFLKEAEDLSDVKLSLFSAPGRTEICGNHTDHQHGCVLAAAVDLDAIAVVRPRKKQRIRVQSQGYPKISVDLDSLSPKDEEKAKTSGLIRGVAAQFISRGASVSGLDAYVTSDVLPGSGLSSSAAFEVLMGTILDHLYNDAKEGAVGIARFGQIAENQYFGKASGLMDQMVSSVGGFVMIDFKDPEKPSIERIDCDLEEAGLTLIVTDTKGSHSGLSDEYSAIPEEMRSVAAFFSKDHLRQVQEEDFFQNIGKLRKDPAISDRAILRSAHFFADNKRVEEEADALKKKDIKRFLSLVNASGLSSETLLQNLYCTKEPLIQEIPLALMLSRRVLGTEGACRVHGGGFAGTIQAFVPHDLTDEYVRTLESVFGRGACHILKIRPSGGVMLSKDA